MLGKPETIFLNGRALRPNPFPPPPAMKKLYKTASLIMLFMLETFDNKSDSCEGVVRLLVKLPPSESESSIGTHSAT